MRFIFLQMKKNFELSRYKNLEFADIVLGILILYGCERSIELGEQRMNDTEGLKDKIKSEQEKLNELLESGEMELLTMDETTRMSRDLDKLIVEFLKLRK